MARARAAEAVKNKIDEQAYRRGKIITRTVSSPCCLLRSDSTPPGFQCGNRDHKRSRLTYGIEDAFWRGLKEIAKNCRTSLPDLVDKIDAAREHSNLSSAIRLFVLDYFKRVQV